MKRYAEYKDSGIEWIGEVPQTWKTSKVGRFYICQLGKMLQPNPATNKDVLMPYLCAANIKKDGVSIEPVKEMWFSESDRNTFAVESGDLLVVEGGDVGLTALYRSNESALIQNALHRVRATLNASNSFLDYWMKYLKAKGYVDLVCNKATIAHFTKDKLINTPLLLPSMPEQQSIVYFLDHKTASIDALIADKQKLVELLQEKRSAVISEAVTKGLDKTTKMKDSGIEWIGKIPAKWELTKLKYFTTKIGSGKTPKGGNEVYADEGVIFVRSQNVHNSGLILEDVAYITAEIDEDLANTRLAFNDVLLNVTGASIGRACLWTIKNVKGNVNQHVCIVRSNDKAIPQYIHYSLISYTGQVFIDSCQTGANRQGLNFEQIANFMLALPLPEEQQIIVDYLDHKTALIDSLISDITTQIEKLKEYRQAVISEVVTGKVAV